MVEILLSLGLLVLAVAFGIFVRASWKFFHLANEHRRKLEMVIVEIVRQMPYEERGPEEQGLHSLIYNCRFRKHGRTYNHEIGKSHIRMTFWDFIDAGMPHEDNHPVLFLKDELDGPYQWDYAKFLRSIGIEPDPELEERDKPTYASHT